VVHPSRFGQVVAVAILGLLSMCASAQAQVAFSPSAPVWNNTVDFSITPQVATDAGGNVYVVWEDDTVTAPYYQIIRFSSLTNGGTTFSPAKPLSNPLGFATNPRIRVDGQGGIDVVWQDNATPGGNYDVFFARSTDGGTNFSPATNVSSANDPGDSTSPQIATDALGNINVVWEGDSIHLGIFLSQSTDGGRTFSTMPANLSPNTSSSVGPQIAVGVDGSINVVWQDTLNFRSVVYFSRSVNSGTSFSNPPTNISNDSGNSSSPQIALDSNGNINIVWVDDTPGHFAIMFRRSDKSATFATSSINVSDDPTLTSQGDCDVPQIGVDANGNIELVWQHSPASSVIHQIFSARSINGGTSFSVPPQNRSNDLGDATKPWLTVDASGGFNLGWQDTSVLQANIFFTHSLDAGATFSAPQNLSKDSGKSSDAQIAADKAGNLNVVWSDDASGVNQVLFSRFTNPQVTHHPPVANAGADQIVECAGPLGTKVKLDGSGSYDPDGTALTYTWTDDANNLVGSTAVVYPVLTTMGAHTFTLTVKDAAGLTDATSTTVTIQDTKAPKLSVSLSPSYLTVSNHKLDQITATVTVSDTCDASPTVQLVSITSNEPIDADDIEAVGGGPLQLGTDVRSFLLGAEHSRAGASRIYTVTYMAMDHSGNTTLASAQVGVGETYGTRKHKKHKGPRR